MDTRSETDAPKTARRRPAPKSFLSRPSDVGLELDMTKWWVGVETHRSARGRSLEARVRFIPCLALRLTW